jgi:hypothetical protein
MIRGDSSFLFGPFLVLFPSLQGLFHHLVKWITNVQSFRLLVRWFHLHIGRVFWLFFIEFAPKIEVWCFSFVFWTWVTVIWVLVECTWRFFFFQIIVCNLLMDKNLRSKLYRWLATLLVLRIFILNDWFNLSIQRQIFAFHRGLKLNLARKQIVFVVRKWWRGRLLTADVAN